MSITIGLDNSKLLGMGRRCPGSLQVMLQCAEIDYGTGRTGHALVTILRGIMLRGTHVRIRIIIGIDVMDIILETCVLPKEG